MGMVGAALEEEGATAFATNTAVNPSELDERVKLKETFIVPAFGTLVLQGRMEQTDDVGSRPAHNHTSSLSRGSS